MIDDQLKERIAQVCAEHSVGLCYLYGSQVLPEDPDEMADLDLGIVSLAWPRKRSTLDVWFALQKAIAPLVAPRALDLVQLDRAGCQLQYEAITNGLPIYAADQELRVKFEDRVVRDWLDFRYVMEANLRDIRCEIRGQGSGIRG